MCTGDLMDPECFCKKEWEYISKARFVTHKDLAEWYYA